jgi:hypothetical protein
LLKVVKGPAGAAGGAGDFVGGGVGAGAGAGAGAGVGVVFGGVGVAATGGAAAEVPVDAPVSVGAVVAVPEELVLLEEHPPSAEASVREVS